MLTPTDVVKHLKTYLPIFTNEFTDFFTVLSASVDASNIITVSVTGHRKSPGDNVIISAGSVRNPLSSSILDDGTVKFETKYEHDLIKPSQELDDQTLTLDNFGNVWDAIFNIIEVKNRMTFNVNLPSGETTAPAVDESQYLIETRKAGFSGVQTIATVPNANTFTIDLSGVPLLPVGPIDNLKIISGFRIAAAADFKRAQAAYSKQDNPYLFVIMTDLDVSKDRHTLNDGVAGFTRQDSMLLRLLQNFSTTIFLPTGDDLSGANAQDLAHSSIYEALISSLYGLEDNDQAIRYLTVPVGMGQGEYNSAYYTHVYDWQLPGSITYRNSFLQWEDVAFRDIEKTLKLFNDSEAEIITNINLDETEI